MKIEPGKKSTQKAIKLKSIHKISTVKRKPLIKIDKFENVYKDHKTKRIAGFLMINILSTKVKTMENYEWNNI